MLLRITYRCRKHTGFDYIIIKRAYQPKKYLPGKWRLITNLSFPEGYSINDAIYPELCSMLYISVDLVARRAMTLGRGALIAKIDIKSAYRLVPICRHDQQWLGMRWKDQTFVDGMLPFSLRFAPKIFNALADALGWIVSQVGGYSTSFTNWTILR